MRRFGLNRGQDSHDDYAKRLASWQLERGLNGADLTPAPSSRPAATSARRDGCCSAASATGLGASMMKSAEPVPLRPPTLGALLEAAEGLPDETVARLIDRHFPWALEVPAADRRPTPLMLRRAVDIPRQRPRGLDR